MVKDLPVGIFDSGVGGLTSAKRFYSLMPNENVIFLGDTARNPYGTKTKETLAGYANDDVDFLQRRGVKAIIIACGTISSNVPIPQLHNLSVPIVELVAPTVQAAIKATKTKRIGIIGTPATIKSGAFNNRLKAIDKEIETVCYGCPQLVTLAQEGKISEEDFVTVNVCKEYLAPIKAFGVDTLILGCTHFPLLAPIIQKIMGDDVTLIDSGYEAAMEAKRILEEKNMCREQPRDQVDYYVTSDPDIFNQVANIFLGEGSDVKSHLADIND